MKLSYNELSKLQYDKEFNYPMKKYTSLRVGGKADLIIYPNNSKELIGLLNLMRKKDIPWVVLGGGSNTIVYDRGIKGVVVSTKKLRKIEFRNSGKILAEAGAVLGTILNKTINRGMSGFEFSAGIPGTVGGGIFMNAGANCGEIKDVTERVWIWDGNKEVPIDRADINFEYRKSNLPENCVITKALFQLKISSKEKVERKVKDYLDKRSKTQPIKYTNTGSIFKNPPQEPAGKLLEELGLKGFKIGGAKISEIHANFIINSGNASTNDILELIEFAKKQALAKRGINLETEVRIIGENN
ncbi:MAG: UDP-N-acetylmuramate dehydrogenase [Thermodesulfobacteriota bacterium]